jgi:serine/threonine protein kinase
MKDKPNIVQIIDYYNQEINSCMTYFILMEYCGSKNKY